ncbi:multiheme c-type cytochrome [Pedobacter ginsengisoli]|uniref:multiheme c-type cytochrome n=1 Tax=Pedobacter ginsengisoli TaxID=363852 RepID=UPI0025518750|nr:multiheme c-type cytochrome [Pedobacter ginsengisoli]
MKGGGRLVLIFGLITALIICFAQCMDSGKELKATETSIAGAETCRQCHQQVYANHLRDPHTHTSHSVLVDDPLNHTVPRSNTFEFNKRLKVLVEKRKGALYQVAYLDGRETMARPMNIAIGSGKHSFTFGSWNGSILHQLPLSYFRSVNSWANSPGFPSDKAYFTRSLQVKCLECHSSYIRHTIEQTSALAVKEKLVKKSLVYGIDCERCHGAAGKHAEFHLKNPEVQQAKYVVLYRSLTRRQKLDACAVCHSGAAQEELKSTFGYQPGEDLNEYFGHVPGVSAESEPDVHGNQIQMLSRSKCFTNSTTMDCGTCHSPHSVQKEGFAVYSKKCISCHAEIKHSVKTLANAMVKTNCIDCHMPLQSSKVISFQQAGQQGVSAYKLHTHRIAVYH